jgi:hypothetical protein
MATLAEIQAAGDAVLVNLRERKAYTAEIAAKANAIDAASPTAKEDLAAIKAEYDSATEKFRSKQKQLTDTFIRSAEGAGFFNKSQAQAIVDRTTAEMNSIMSGGNPAESALGAKSKEITQTAAVKKESAASDTAESAITDAEKNTTPLENPIPEESPDIVEQQPKPKPTTRLDPPSKNKIAEENKKTASNARPNPMFEYADYTYGLSLHVIPPENYNKLMTQPGYQYMPVTDAGEGTVLIASGGRRNDTNFKRHPSFNEDFYFKDLKFTTIVGLNSRSKNTNTIEAAFTIVEPYGLTLINRLLSMANNIKAKSWMQIPFLLEINFFGNTSLGEPHNKILGQTKYIPIKIIGCKIKVSKDGGEYQISAIPFNHQAYIDSNVRTPAAFEVTAKTVKDFFSSDTNKSGEAENILNVNNAVAERREAINKEATEELKNNNPNSARVDDLKKSSQQLGQAARDSSYLVGSYAAAINSFQKQLTNNNGKKLQQYSETFSFIFPDAIANSNIVFPNKTSLNKIPMPDPTSRQALAEIRSRAGIQTNGFNRTEETFGINAGTTIVDVINQVMRNSDFIRLQITDPTIDVQKVNDQEVQNYANTAEKTINWFRIVPIIKIKDFDLVRDTYSKEIIYTVEIYTFHNTKSPVAPKSLPKNALKEYHYIFTGQNESIIDFSLDFDTMFYTVVTADKTKLEKNTPSPAPEENLTGSAPKQKAETGVQDHMVKNNSIQMDMAASQGGSPDAKGQAVNDLYKTTLSDSKGDMISVRLKIIGDPEFIKQDDVFFNPLNRSSKSIIDKNGSLSFDRGEMHALLTFRTPLDFDQTTGLAKWDGPSSTSVFSGMYRVITVENEFRSGQFTQNLDLVRMFGQEKYDTISGTNTASDTNRKQEIKTIAESKSQNADQDTIDELTFEKGSSNTYTPAAPLQKIKPPPASSVISQSDAEIKELMDLNNNLKNVAPTDINNSENNFFE